MALEFVLRTALSHLVQVRRVVSALLSLVVPPPVLHPWLLPETRNRIEIKKGKRRRSKRNRPLAAGPIANWMYTDEKQVATIRHDIYVADFCYWHALRKCKVCIYAKNFFVRDARMSANVKSHSGLSRQNRQIDSPTSNTPSALTFSRKEQSCRHRGFPPRALKNPKEIVFGREHFACASRSSLRTFWLSLHFSPDFARTSNVRKPALHDPKSSLLDASCGNDCIPTFVKWIINRRMRVGCEIYSFEIYHCKRDRHWPYRKYEERRTTPHWNNTRK